MTKRTKSWISGAMAVLMIATVMSGCGKDQKVEEKNAPKGTAVAASTPSWQTATPTSGGIGLPITQNKITYEYMMVEHPSTPIKDTFIVFPELEKRTNVQIKLLPVPNDGWEQKYSVVMASGSIPDFMYFMTDYKTINNYGPKGMFENVYSHVNKMPNLKKLMVDIPEISDYMISKNELYAAPIDFVPIHPKTVPQRIFMMREDILKKHNLTQPKTYDELYEVLKALKKAYPDSTPWTNRNGLSNLIDVMLPSWGLITSSTNMYTYLDQKSGKWEYALYSDNFKKMVEFVNKCYSGGLLDKEFVLTSAKQWEEKMVNGKGFFTLDWNNRVASVTKTGVKAGNPDFKLGPLPVLKANVPGSTQQVLGNFRVERFIGVKKGIKEPDVAMKFLDYWLYSEDGSLLTWRGIDGKTTLLDKEKKITNPHPDIRSEFFKEAKYMAKDDFGINYNGFIGINVEYYGWSNKQSEDTLREEVVNIYGGKGLLPPPVMLLTDEEKENEREIVVNIKDFVDLELTKFMVGQRLMSDWSKFVDELKKKGSDNMLKLYNNAQARKK